MKLAVTPHICKTNSANVTEMLCSVITGDDCTGTANL